MNDDNWKHRSANMLCGTCMYFVEKIKALPIPGGSSVSDNNCYPPSVNAKIDIDTEITIPQSALGRCRRHAPTRKGWPAIFSADWCGDHKIDEDKI